MPFSQETLDYIESLDIDQDITTLESTFKIRPVCLRNMKCSSLLLKRGAARGLNLTQIGQILCRPDDDDSEPSRLEKIVKKAEAKSAKPENFGGMRKISSHNSFSDLMKQTEMRSFLGNALSDQTSLSGQRTRIMTEDVQQLGPMGTQRRLIQIQGEDNMSESSEVKIDIDSPRSFKSRFGSDVCEES
jgi:hypothetical protein